MGGNSGAIAGTPRTVLAVNDISICSARTDWQPQLCRTRYEIGAIHPSGTKKLGRYRLPDANVSSSGGVASGLP